ncbi:hypothetical protein HPB50_013053 [Hyalomma asiaticum]|uniref:Uncharacterized protein n=1 Tax=Hyalomma asiaticum TaxID=266040 RepID=A0ACB7SQ37_HYAAI|nr:hypothetical protein HPB50_013053 [Hyalomma asiaticum]
MRFIDARRLFALQVLVLCNFPVSSCGSLGTTGDAEGVPAVGRVDLQKCPTYLEELNCLLGNVAPGQGFLPSNSGGRLLVCTGREGVPPLRCASPGTRRTPASPQRPKAGAETGADGYCSVSPPTGNLPWPSLPGYPVPGSASTLASPLTYKAHHPLALFSGLGGTPTMRFIDARRLFALQDRCDEEMLLSPKLADDARKERRQGSLFFIFAPGEQLVTETRCRWSAYHGCAEVAQRGKAEYFGQDRPRVRVRRWPLGSGPEPALLPWSLTASQVPSNLAPCFATQSRCPRASGSISWAAVQPGRALLSKTSVANALS